MIIIGTRRRGAIAEAMVLVALSLVLPPLASVVAFSAVPIPKRQPALHVPGNRQSSALASKYSQQPSRTSACTSSALFRRQGTSVPSPFFKPDLLYLQQRRKGSRTERMAIGSSNHNMSSKSDKLSQCVTKLQALLQLCSQPLSQLQQWAILVAFYFFHLIVLSQHTILFGWQLIPNNKGHFCSVGWDSVAGMISLALWIYVKKDAVFFRKPWRKLVEGFPSSTDTGNSSSETTTKATPASGTPTLADIKALENKKDNDIASKVLQNLPRNQLLTRSPRSPDPAVSVVPGVAEIEPTKSKSPESLDLVSNTTTNSNSSASVTSVVTTEPTKIKSPESLDLISNTRTSSSSSASVSSVNNNTATRATQTNNSLSVSTLIESLKTTASQPPRVMSTATETTILNATTGVKVEDVHRESSNENLLNVKVANVEEVEQLLHESTEASLPLNATAATEKATKAYPSVTLRKEDIIVESSRLNGAPTTSNGINNKERIPLLPDLPTIESSPVRKNTHQNDSSTNNTNSDTSMYFTLDELNDRMESFKKGTLNLLAKALDTPSSRVHNKNSNTTHIDKQGPDLSALSLSDPAQRKQLLARGTSTIACMLLVQTYFFTGRFSFFWEDTLYAMAGVGFPLTVAMHRSLCVLLGHLTWVAAGSAILRAVVRPKFFGKGNTWYRQNAVSSVAVADDADTSVNSTKAVPRRRRNNNWIWWVIGGYSVSAWFFNVADFVNLYALPSQVLEDAILQEGVVTQLINPENNDFLASLVGYIAPCLSAPWWEEILYRGFFFPALSLYMPVWASVLISGIVFSAHHLSLTAALPLAVLGWTWSGLYMASDNLWTTILVHALWNTRVFLSSWLGL